MVAGCAAFHPLGEARRMGAAARTGSGTTGSGIRNDFSGWHKHQGSPQSGGSPKKGASFEERDHREALGRSRGGYGTKVCVIADGHGKAFGFALAPGQAHELPLAPAMLDSLPATPLWVVADKGYASNAMRERIWDMGARPAIPAKRRDGPVACPKWAYRCRHLVENLWARLKEWRAVATRYEKTATSFLAVIHIAAAADWIKL
ncbi:Transposase [Acetobacter pomorum DM001]|uniref:Transposase n=6 Tax=Acetobacter TaxID=434 RepID=F1YRA6_9PROT|nr:transposase [Acetobacter pasteurianus]ANA14429.1 transposase [Acetobacter oryzifermentans]EGE47444.1 Transposase [Acetobacter pomorum DM001]ALR88249.1 transposase [Acetobacter pasteurianus]ANA15217.1 transposase [Acetobacter oryzifermentans]